MSSSLRCGCTRAECAQGSVRRKRGVEGGQTRTGGWLGEQLLGEKLVSPRYERGRIWWAFVTFLVLISTALYLAGLESWVY